MKAWIVDRNGFTRTENMVAPKLSPAKIRVRVQYAGVGFADVMAVRGAYPLAPRKPYSPGYECYGTVETIGGQVTFASDKVAPGDRVVALLDTMGGYREFVDLEPWRVVLVPKNLEDAVAAALPLNYLTAWGLFEENEVSKGTVLVHGAAGGVGSAVLECALQKGLRAYGTCSAHKAEFVKARGGTALDSSADWAREILAREPDGVNAVFDAFGLQSLKEGWKVLSPSGTLSAYGFYPGTNDGLPAMVKGMAWLGTRRFFGGKRRTSLFSLPMLVRSNHAWYRNTLAGILKLAAEKKISPAIHGVVNWAKASEAHRLLLERKASGKVLLAFY